MTVPMRSRTTWMQLTSSGPTALTFQTISFPTPCLGCVGNLGRNTFVGPGYVEPGYIVCSRIFRLSDRFRLQFRAEAFNILNHTNFQLGAENVGPSGNNRLNSPEFGKAGGTFSPRNLQFGLKLSF